SILHTSDDALSLYYLYAAPTTEIYTLSLHDALPIYQCLERARIERAAGAERVQRREWTIAEDDPEGTRLCLDCTTTAQCAQQATPHARRAREPVAGKQSGQSDDCAWDPLEPPSRHLLARLPEDHACVRTPEHELDQVDDVRVRHRLAGPLRFLVAADLREHDAGQSEPARHALHQ